METEMVNPPRDIADLNNVENNVEENEPRGKRTERKTMTNSENVNIIAEVFNDAPQHLEEQMNLMQEEPLIVNGKAIKTPREALEHHSDTDVKANLVGYLALIFPEHAGDCWQELIHKCLPEYAKSLLYPVETDRPFQHIARLAGELYVSNHRDPMRNTNASKPEGL